MTLPALTRLQLTFFCAAFITLVYNWALWQKLQQLLAPLNFASAFLFCSAVVLVFAIAHGVCHLFSLGRLQKIWLALALVCSAAASYYQVNYHVVYDKTMIHNILATDYHEAYGLLSLRMIIWIGTLGLIPAGVLLIWPVKSAPLQSQALGYGLGFLLSLGLIALVALVFYKDYASLFRNNRELKHLIIPSSFMYSLYGFALEKSRHSNGPVEVVGEDAHLGASWQNSKPVVLVLVVGETARKANFPQAGYSKNTSPRLAQEETIFFDQVSSCGTATAVSVPCMFSHQGRKNFDLSRAETQENLLDVVQRAGLSVSWVDNNSGCKGVCQRVISEVIPTQKNDDYCRDGECFDMALLRDFPARLASDRPGKLIVLHQKGSHGPSYFERSPAQFKQFLPECTSNQLQRCSSEEITNAYDNSILYTDYVLSQLISELKSASEYDTAMLYVSDHGESLGENGFYLHGFPYALAPKEQIQIPMLLWLSDGFKSRLKLDWQCLNNNRHTVLSHDNLFSSLLALLDIKTQVFNPQLDFTSGCINAHSS
jgi:lipid A ethanolaminephosphotransferase